MPGVCQLVVFHLLAHAIGKLFMIYICINISDILYIFFYCRFHCVFLVDNKQVSEGIALNKKDAKTKAGSEALRKLLSSETVVSITDAVK
jgi:hypothetical protein